MGSEAGTAPPLFHGRSRVWRDAKREEFPLGSEFGLPSSLPRTDPYLWQQPQRLTLLGSRWRRVAAAGLAGGTRKEVTFKPRAPGGREEGIG